MRPLAKKFIGTTAAIVLLSLTFWAGTQADRYLTSMEQENSYPFDFREVWVKNQPTCEDWTKLRGGDAGISAEVVRDKENRAYARVVSIPESAQDGRVVASILGRDQKQFIEEVWLDCD